MKRFHKKGQIPALYAIAELIVSFLVVFIMMRASYGYATGTFHHRVYLANDVALTTTSLGSFPTNIDYYYPLFDFPYDLRFQNSEVQVLGAKGEREIKHAFVTNADSQFDVQFKSPKAIVISQQGGTLSVKDVTGITLNWNKEYCENADFTNIIPFILDPGHGGSDDSGVVDGKNILKESDIVRAIALVVSSHHRDFGYTRDLEADQSKDLDSRQTSIIPNNGFLSLHVGKYDGKENYIKVYYNAKNTQSKISRALGCKILNALIEAYPRQITGTAIIPLDPQYLDAHFNILDNEKAAD